MDFLYKKFADRFTYLSPSWRLVTWIQMCKFESLQKEESRALSADSLKAYSKPRAFNWCDACLVWSWDVLEKSRDALQRHTPTGKVPSTSTSIGSVHETAHFYGCVFEDLTQAMKLECTALLI